MVDKLIPPQREEQLTPDGKPTRRFSYYLDQNAEQTNNSTELTESDPSSINLSSAQLSQVNKKVAELVNESLISQVGLITKLAKRIEQLENTITVNQNNNKKVAQLENDFTAPFYKTRYNKLTIKDAILGEVTADNVTISEKIKLPLTDDAASPTIQFGDGDTGFYEELDDVLILSLAGTKRYTFDSTILRTPFGKWTTAGINLNSGGLDDYSIGGTVVLTNTALGATVLASSLTSVGILVSVNTSSAYFVNGTQVVTGQGAAVIDAAGGATVDAEARTAINTLLARVRAHGLIA